MSEQSSGPGADADEQAQMTHEGNAHADHEVSGEETRGATQRWGSSSPGQNTQVGVGDSEPPPDGEKLPNQS